MKRDADKVFPIMYRYAGDFYEVIRREFSQSISLEETDHFGFMALCFVHKQIEHARTLLLLLENEYSIDATVLARVMLEGHIYLSWAYLEQEERALSWRSFALVYDLETLLDKKTRGDQVDSQVEAKLRERLGNEASRFLTRGGAGKEFPNPYQKSWNFDKDGNRVSLPQMVSELGDRNLKVLYDDLSQIGHWTIRGIGPLIKRSSGKVSISFMSKDNKTTACAVLAQSLYGVAGVTAEHFDLPVLNELTNMMDAYMVELGLIPAPRS